MAQRTYIKFKDAGFRAILNSAGTAGMVHDAAYRIASRAGGLRVKERKGSFGGGRPIAYVVTTAKNPIEAEKQRRALEAAVHGGG